MRRAGRSLRVAGIVGLALALSFGAAACGNEGGSGSGGKVTLRLGYFPNLTHAPAIIGVEKGLFRKELGAGVTLTTTTFNAGPDVVTAIFSNALDIAYIGPNPAINAWAQSKGAAIRIISGATSGGAALVVKPSITSVSQLKGKKIASPQLGNTQDVALRAFLKDHGYKTDKTGGGDVKVVAQANSQTLETFKSGLIDGAWVPEPWATRLVLEGGGKVLIDEKTLWPDGRFVTTHVIVRTAFLREHGDVVENFLRGHVATVDYANENPEDAKTIVNGSLEKITGKALKTEVIDEAWKNLIFTIDPVASSLRASAKDAEAVGLLDRVDLEGIYDLKPLNAVLKALRRPDIVTD
ncbi:MAG: ABC transporter substrate-binding protein [Actinomycetota bacterium]